MESKGGKKSSSSSSLQYEAPLGYSIADRSAQTEWTREEDEKLLHLAKIMPTQWGTIAPIVGRTPSQCLERYEKLLDAACAKDENYEPGDDPRKLRPGEIDPNPPDPVDMDEDEKEMLSEACARLAERKAREKQLEEARRLASLQKEIPKRRELKRRVTPRKREIQTPNPMATPSATPGPGVTPRLGMTPRDGYSFSMTPKGTPFRDELHINEDLDVRDTSKLELHQQAELKRNLRYGLTNLPQAKDEYQIGIQPIPEEAEEAEEKIEEDMSDRIARERAQEQARLEALLRKRSKVLQRELPRPPVASLEIIKKSLMRGDEDRSSFVPPTPFEQADEMINRELLALLEHDNAKYPIYEKSDEKKKKGTKRMSNGKLSAVPELEDFEEDQLKQADSLIKEEIQFLRGAMGHESESFDDFVKARDACQEDLMFFPARSTFGLASVAGNSEKLASLQNEFDMVKKRVDEEAKRALRLEQKIKVLTHGYQTRGEKLWSQTEATFKQMDTAATELECFKVLQKQELLASTLRVNGLVDEVNKQRALEESLQSRYADLLAEHDGLKRLLEEHKMRLQMEEENAARARALEEEAARSHAIEEDKAADIDAMDELPDKKGQLNVDFIEDGTSIEEPAPPTETSQLTVETIAETDSMRDNEQTPANNYLEVTGEISQVVIEEKMMGDNKTAAHDVGVENTIDVPCVLSNSTGAEVATNSDENDQTVQDVDDQKAVSVPVVVDGGGTGDSTVSE